MSRYLFFYPDVQGGVKSFVTNYINNMHSATAIAYGRENKLFHQIEEVNEKLKIVKFSCYSSRLSQFKFLKKCIEKQDILICNDSLELEVIHHYRLTNKIIYILHGDLNHYKNILNSFGSIIDMVICVSMGLREKYEKIYPSLNFAVSHPYINQVEHKRRIENEVLNIVYIGRFEYLKGADLFIQLLDGKIKNIQWHIITTSHGLDERLFSLVGKRAHYYFDLENAEVLSFLNEMDLLVFPSRSEGFGIAVLEAMSKGVVPIALDIPIGIPDQIKDHFNGFIIKEDKWHCGASSIISNFVNGKYSLSQFGMNAIKTVDTNFNREKLVANFMRVVESHKPLKTKKKAKPGSLRKMDYIPEPLFRIAKICYLNSKR